MDRTEAPSAAADASASSTPDRVLDTAARLFWEKGYAATTTREIAAAVGIQQASLYYHVTSKEELLYQLCVSALERLLADVQRAVEAESDSLNRIRILMRTHLSTLLTHQVRHVTMLTELRALSKTHRAAVLALRKKYAALVRSVLEAAQAEGRVRTDIPSKYLYLALLNILNWAVIWFRRDRELTAGQLAAQFAPIYLDGAAAEPRRLPWSLPDLDNDGARPNSRPRKTANAARKPTSQRLLGEAAALFAKNGYGATSIREIAAALGIRKASLYHHIGSKEDLLYAIFQSSLEQIRHDVETALAGVRDPLQRIRTLVRAHLESMLLHQEAHSVAVAETHFLSPERREHVRSLREAYDGLVRSVLQEAQSAGALRDDIPVKYLSLSLFGLMNRVEVWYHRGGPLSPGQMGELLATVFLTGAIARP